MSIILKAERISKQYRLGTVGAGTLGDDLKRLWCNIRGKEDPFLKVGGINDRSALATENYVWALRDINFEVKQGEVLGIIGKNGAGKSTLLKLLSRVTSPTTGSIKTRGRIASLLEVGTGFHGELTGRENIFMNGAVLGMTKTEIKSKLDEIIAFSGCEKYIDTPVKRYSSGMTVRLGFSVAAHLEPEILVVDEVLAVGDAEFQKKAIGKMNSLSQGEGRTVLFVSHNMASVQNLCTKVMVLDNGHCIFEGDNNKAIDYYLVKADEVKGNGRVNFDEVPEYSNDWIRLIEFRTEDFNGNIRTTFKQSQRIKVFIKFQLFAALKNMRTNLRVETTNGEEVFMTSSHKITKELMKEGVHTLEVIIPKFLLNERRYVLILNLGIPGVKYLIKPFKVSAIDIVGENSGGSDYVEKWPGVVAPKLNWVLNGND